MSWVEVVNDANEVLVDNPTNRVSILSGANEVRLWTPPPPVEYVPITEFAFVHPWMALPLHMDPPR